ncbi:DUF4037 domain-containing protein [Rhizobium leguminosarum]|nr:DUF4037 domain-containing protein [Rhizobium leguminosarum]TBF87916.1 DUF4037 domain-containing protein [Rhizobium leguminosarum]TBG07103.1 DUF4037 domain-containing protein [Rhizobium leguminosarum]TBG07576.1 DUF4037 domain-containing protein [Rhizobium leguminosarum]TBG30787.1 DUF4037 domain-containing protein [Rhizobium leguminosarum]TBG50028.1 DUF4037 domain-containing protein [Rhizobium leguminosarum]
MTQGIGIDLSYRFHETLVAPILHAHAPGVAYAAARIGLGSEVLGYDDEMSPDHDYGPCVQIFLREDAFPSRVTDIMRILDPNLPARFAGWAVRYPTNVCPPADDARQGMLGSAHGVEFYTVPTWSDRFLGRQFATDLTTQDWLSYSEQIFLTVTGGAVFRDDVGELTALRDRLAHFPRDVWLYQLAAHGTALPRSGPMLAEPAMSVTSLAPVLSRRAWLETSCGSPC